MLNKSGEDGFRTISVKLSDQQRAFSFPWQPTSLNNGGCANKNIDISAVIHPKILNLVPNYFLVI